MADVHSGSCDLQKILPLIIHGYFFIVLGKITTRFSNVEIYSMKSGNIAHEGAMAAMVADR